MNFLIKMFAGRANPRVLRNLGSEEMHSRILSLMSTGYSVDKGWGLANEYTGMAISTVISGSENPKSAAMLNLGPVIQGDHSLRKVIDL